MHSLPGDRRRRALGGIGIVAMLIALAAIFDLWPFGGELTRAEFAVQGDEICAQAHDAFEELQQEPPRSPREAVDLTEELLGIAEDEIDRIAALNHPSSLDAEVDRYLEAREEGIELLREGLEAAEAREVRRYEAAQAELAAGQRPRRRLARQIGFRECSKPLGRA